ncbi:MAG: hypothetical protein L6R37_002868 [Teloschistes peruensis]|nr:MAG: hypothetical protein L6R37_002868 [Teloschistes peruensis]
MRFGRTLQSSVYEPWKSKYIDYPKLKRLLKEGDSPNGRDSARSKEKAPDWTEEDEGAFVDELVNVQLEKVNAFHDETHRSLRDRTTDCESRLQELADSDKQEAKKDNQEAETAKAKGEEDLPGMLKKLDGITEEINELEKYSRINYTGFLKAAKKHDRVRGSQYRVRPLLQVRLAALPFNSEDYSSLLYQLSAMYSFVRQRLKGQQERTSPEPESKDQAVQYKSYKFWVHPENLLEVKTYILRRLPVLVYNPQAAKTVEGGQQDPRITSLYFDNPGFSLYTDKVGKDSGASSLRLRWAGHLKDKPEIFLEKKTTEEGGNSNEVRFPIKAKYISDFLSDRYKMEKSLDKLQERQGSGSSAVIQMRTNVDTIQKFIKENELQPMLRANYKRTAFQIPGDDRVRVSLDTDVAFLREDSLDPERPCRDPSDWHRPDVDANEMEFPFPGIRRGEISRFPYALLEIKVREGVKRRMNDWVNDLMSSHLVKEAPRFSKFVHGIAQLFEDHVNSFPFWLSNLETDIRRDPEMAFHEEQEKKAKHAAEEQAVGSFIGSHNSRAFTAAVGSPISKSLEANKKKTVVQTGDQVAQETDSDEDEGTLGPAAAAPPRQGLQSFLPSFSNSRYGRWIKDTGPVVVEPKGWGWWVYTLRSQMIRERSGKDFDNVAGPIVVCLALVIALCLNFGLKHQALLRDERERDQRPIMYTFDQTVMS